MAEATFGAGVVDRPGALAAIDLGGDGADDLLIARSNGIVIWENRGGSMFEEVGVFDALVPGQPRDVGLADFNADGLDDVVVVGESQPGRVGRLFSDEMSVFVPQPVVDAGANPTRVEVGDVDDDGQLDLVLMSADLPDLFVAHVLLSDGADGFLVPLDVTLAQAPLDLAVTEITGDGALDLVVANGQGIAVLAGRGTGGFDEVAQLGLSAQATQAAIAVTDLDGDGRPELVRAAEIAGAGELAIWTWNGDDTDPTPSQTYALPTALTGLVAADIDGDGREDLVAATGGPVGVMPAIAEVLVVPAESDGTLRCQSVFALPRPAVSLATGDFDDDGATDIAAASGEDTITLLLSSG